MSQIAAAAIAIMTKEVLMATLKETHGLSPQHNTGIEKLRATLCEQENISINEVNTLIANAAPATNNNTDSTSKNKKQVIGAIVMFASGESNESQRDVWCSHNGKSLQVKRDLNTAVKQCFIDVLRDAKKTTFKKTKRGGMSGEATKTPKHSMQIIKKLYIGDEHLLGKTFEEDEVFELD